MPHSVEAQNHKIADAISWGTVSAQVGLDTLNSWRAEDRKIQFKQQALRIGITVGLSEIVKRLVHEERPDHSDKLSFWSEHTAIAATSQGWNFYVGIPLTGATGIGRVVAKRHYPWDVLTGAAVGTVVERFVH